MKEKQVSTTALIPRIEEQILEKSLFKSGDRILVACSGGPDSTALFFLLRELSLKHDWKLGLLHFNHRLRRDAKKDEAFVRSLARKFKVPFYCGRGNVTREAKRTKTSLEECARKMRYDFFLKAARLKKYSKIAFAHTRDDQAETVLMRILQGTGLRGLQGIRECQRMGKTGIIRPLLCVTKNEILSFCREASVRYRLDKSNNCVKFLRNRIRRELIPALRRDFNPRVVEALSRIPAIVSGESELIGGLEEKAWKRTFKRIRGSKVELRRTPFLKCHPALQFRLVDKALKLLDSRSGLSFEAWERLRCGLTRLRFCSSLPKDIDFALTSQKLTIYKKKRAS